MDVRLIGGPLPIVVGAVALLGLGLALSARPPASARWGRRPRSVWIAVLGVTAASGAAAGLLACFVTDDVFDVFGATLTPVTRAWSAIGVAGTALGVLALVTLAPVRPAWHRRAAAVAGILASVLVAALGINADFGEFPTLSAAFGDTGIRALPSRLDGGPAGERTGAPAGPVPQHGLVGTVDIPAPASGFPARGALVYVPPAGLEHGAPRLPVLVMLSGEPGSPSDLIESGHLDRVLDAFAMRHHGLAPIVVIPDQLGSRHDNPMCVDGPLGNAATYLAVDVPAWVRTHLHVLDDRADWAIGGFSEGGTCAIQLGAAHPELFAGVLDISGETAPSLGDPAMTIARGFGGNADAYHAAIPATILAAHAPYPHDEVAVFAYGALDVRFGPGIPRTALAAHTAGMRTSVLVSPATGHDWYTVQWAERHALPVLLRSLEWR